MLAYPIAGEGNCLLNLSRYDEAIVALNIALGLATAMADKEIVADIRFNLAKANWATSKKAAARKFAEAAHKPAGSLPLVAYACPMPIVDLFEKTVTQIFGHPWLRQCAVDCDDVSERCIFL